MQKCGAGWWWWGGMKKKGKKKKSACYHGDREEVPQNLVASSRGNCFSPFRASAYRALQAQLCLFGTLS